MTRRTWLTRIDELAEAHPDLNAVMVTGEAGGTLSWRELADRSAGVARLFAGRGIGRGSVVSVALPNSIAHILASVGAWRLGATLLSLRHDLPAPERARMLALAEAALVVGDASDGDRAVSAAEVLGAPAISPGSLPAAPVASPAWLVASGGSTGSPKLIVPPISTAIGGDGFAFSEQSHFADSSNHRHPSNLICTPLGHMHALALLYATLVQDFRVVVMHKFDVEAMLDLIEKERISFIAFVPTILIRALRSPTIKNRDLSSIERTLVGAGATPDWAIREWIDIIGPTKFMQGYGASEGAASSFIRGDEWLEHPGSVGKPIDAEVMVADENGQALPRGEVGELYFKPLAGEHRFRYVGQTTMRSLPGGWISIGDLGRVDEEGYLYIADRRTDMVVTGGANVYVAEVEAALTSHPDIADAVVIGLKDSEWSRRVHALIQVRQGADSKATLDALPAHCKQRLAPYKVPRSYEIVGDVGRTEAGKINRQALVKAREKDTE